MMQCKQMKMISLITLAGLLFLCDPSAAAEKKDPYLQPDESWISLSGTAVAATEESFIPRHCNQCQRQRIHD